MRFIQGKMALTGTLVLYSTELQMLIKKTLQKKRNPFEDPASIKSPKICQEPAKIAS